MVLIGLIGDVIVLLADSIYIKLLYVVYTVTYALCIALI